jgi:hypothetical protein
MADPPEARASSGAAPNGAQATTRKRGRRAGRRRGKRATTLARIKAAARDRQAEWAESRRAPVVEQLTGELNDLYDELRDERKAAPVTDDRVRASAATRQWVSEETL